MLWSTSEAARVVPEWTDGDKSKPSRAVADTEAEESKIEKERENVE